MQYNTQKKPKRWPEEYSRDVHCSHETALDFYSKSAIRSYNLTRGFVVYMQDILGFVKIHNDAAVREQYILRIMKLVRTDAKSAIFEVLTLFLISLGMIRTLI